VCPWRAKKSRNDWRISAEVMSGDRRQRTEVGLGLSKREERCEKYDV
jgi:hypothetical protein